MSIITSKHSLGLFLNIDNTKKCFRSTLFDCKIRRWQYTEQASQRFEIWFKKINQL